MKLCCVHSQRDHDMYGCTLKGCACETAKLVDRFSTPVTFSTGVQWNPTDAKPMDQAPYNDYLAKQ